MKKSSVIIAVLVFLIAGLYICYNIYLGSVSNIDTTYAVMSQADNSVKTDCFIVRDEYHSSGKSNSAIITNSGNGIYIPYVSDGSRVAAGDIIALFFSSEENAKAYREKKFLEETLDYYNKLQSQSVLTTLDVDKLEKSINENIVLLTSSIEDNNFGSAAYTLSTLKYDISAKKIATGEKIDFSEQIKTLNSQIKSLSSRAGSYSAIRADFPGCFISSVDGYETCADYSRAQHLNVSEIDSLLSTEPNEVSPNTIGKLIDEYNWYAVCKVPKSSLEKINIGNKVVADFENTNVSKLQMTVASVSPVSDGYASVVLVSNEMNSDIAHLRKEKIHIIVDSFEGIKVPREAIRSSTHPDEAITDETGSSGNLCVYILYGQVIRQRNIRVLYFGQDYAIVEKETDNSDALKLYDRIITKGRNLYDGKIIN